MLTLHPSGRVLLCSSITHIYFKTNKSEIFTENVNKTFVRYSLYGLKTRSLKPKIQSY